MKKSIMAVIALSAASAFAADKYDCKAQVVQMTGEKSHTIKDIEQKNITIEAFRGKLTAYKNGQAQYSCTSKEELITGAISFAGGASKRNEEAVSGKIPGHANMSSMADQVKAAQTEALSNKQKADTKAFGTGTK